MGVLKRAALAAAIMMIFLTCDNFTSGLGEKVDITPPVITVVYPNPGAFIRGVEVFRGTADDDHGVRVVQASIEGGEWQDITWDGESKTWALEVDTRIYNRGEDGPFSIDFRAADGSRKVTSTEPLSYTIKNRPPQIEMHIPMLRESDDPAVPTPPFEDKTIDNRAPKLSGLSLDREGIAQGYPKIKFWPAYAGTDVMGRAFDYTTGEPPDDDPLFGWETADLNPEYEAEPFYPNKEFNIPLRRKVLVDGRYTWGEAVLEVNNYRFKVKAQDRMGVETIFPKPGSANPWVTITLTNDVEYPEVALDLAIPGTSDSYSEAAYTAGSAADKYVDAALSYQRGDFVFQVTAAHNEGIVGADLTWRRENSSEEFPLRWTKTEELAGKTKIRYTVRITDRDLGGGEEGTFILKVAPVSSFGARPPQAPYWTVVKDKTVPAVELSGVTSAIYTPDQSPDKPAAYPQSLYTLNQEVEFSLLARDDRAGFRSAGGKRELVYFLVPDDRVIALDRTGFPQDYSPGGTADNFIDDTNKFRANTNDTAAFPLNVGAAGKYVVHLFARDNALNVAYQKVPVFIDQTSDEPRLRIDFPAVRQDYGRPVATDISDRITLVDTPANVLGPNGYFSLSLVDDDGVDLSTATIKAARITESTTVDPRPGGNYGGSLGALTHIPAQSTALFGGGIAADKVTRVIRQDTLAAILGYSPPLLTDGTYYMEIAAQDTNGKAKTLPVWFAINTQGPKIEVTGPAENFYVKGNQLVNGTVSDANGIPWEGSDRQAYKDGAFSDYQTNNGGAFPNLATGTDPRGPGLWISAAIKGDAEASRTPWQPVKLKADPVYDGTDKVWKYTWEADINLGNTGDAEIEITLRGRDVFGRESSVVRTVRMDTEPPETGIKRPPLMVKRVVEDPPGTPVTRNYVNGTIHFEASAVDTSGIKIEYRDTILAPSDNTGNVGLPMVKWWLLPATVWPTKGTGAGTDAGEPDFDYPGGTYFDDRHYSAEIDTTSIGTSGPNNGPYILHVLAADNLGGGSENIGRFPLPTTPEADMVKVYVWQDTDLPVIEVTRPGKVADATKPIVITATVTDDDGIPTTGSPITVGFFKTNSSDQAVTDTNNSIVDSAYSDPTVSKTLTLGTDYTLGSSNTVAEIQFSLSATEIAALSAPGSSGNKILMHITASDDAARKYGQPAVTPPVSENHRFILDDLEPVVEFQNGSSTPLAENQAYNKVSPPPLYIKVTEANLEEDPLDATGNTVVLWYRFDGVGDYLKKSFIKGSGAGQYNTTNGVVVWDVFTDPAILSAINNDFHKNGSGNFAANTDANPYLETGTPYRPSGYGPHYIQITAKDLAGKSKSPQWAFVIDSAGPVISFTNPSTMVEITNPDLADAASLEAALNGGKRDRTDLIVENAPSIRGSFFDEYSNMPAAGSTVPPSGTPQYKHYRYRIDYPRELPSPGSVTGKNPSNRLVYSNPTIESTQGNEGYNGWRTAPAAWQSGSGHSVTWKIPLWYQAGFLGHTGTEWTDWVHLDDGLHWIEIEAFDEHGYGTASKRYAFRLDSQAPELTITNVTPSTIGWTTGDLPNGKIFKNVSSGNVFQIMGTATDANFDSLTVTINSAPVYASDFSLVPIGNDTYTWTVTMSPAQFNSLGADGLKTMRIVAKDKVGWTKETEWQFYKDTAAPEIVFSNMAAAANNPATAQRFREQGPKVQGTVLDASPLVKLTASIQSYNYGGVNPSSPVYNENLWQDVSGQTNADLVTIGASGLNTPYTWVKDLTTIRANPADLDGFYRIRVTAEDQALTAAPVKGNETVSPWMYFYIDRASPALSSGALPANHPYYRNDPGFERLTFSGTAQDANGIVLVRAKLVPKSSGQTVPTWTDTDPKAVFTGGTYTGTRNWTVYVPTTGLLDGEYRLFIEAEDGSADGSGGRFRLDRDITLDNTAPVLRVMEVQVPNRTPNTTTSIIDATEAASYALVFGDPVVVEGRLEEQTSAVDEFYYALGYTGTDWAARADSGFNWRMEGSPAAQWYLEKTSGEQASQPGGNDWISINLTGSYSWRLVFSNKDIKFIHDDLTQSVRDRYLIADPGNPDLWHLPIYFKVKDKAGNEKRYRRALTINLQEGKAAVSFTNPTADDRQFGGTLRLQGTASHSSWVQDVMVRVLESNGTTWVRDRGAALDDYVDTGLPAKNGSTDGWMKAQFSTRGPEATWFIDLNQLGDLSPALGTGTRTIVVEAFAWGSGNQAHNVRGEEGIHQRIRVVFKEGVPRFTAFKWAAGTSTDWDAAAALTMGTTFNGTITLMAEVRHTAELASIRWHDDTTGIFNAYEILNATATTGADGIRLVRAGKVGNDWIYRVFFTLDTVATSGNYTLIPLGGRFAGKAGSYGITLMAEDGDNFRAQYSMDIKVDNFYPFGKYTGNYYAAGTNYGLQGEAWDMGTGAPGEWFIKKVLVFFRKGGTIVPVKAGVTGSAPMTTQRVMNVRTDEISSAGTLDTNFLIPQVGTNQSPAASDWGIWIESPEYTADINGNGFLESLNDHMLVDGDTRSGSQWAIPNFDTTVLPDGPLELHFIVYDGVGNASHYETELVVRNNVPKVLRVTLGTHLHKPQDLGYTPAADEQIAYSENYNATGFTVRNNYLSVQIRVNGGTNRVNPPLKYRLEYIDSKTSIAVTAITKGEVYAVNNPGTGTDWAKAGLSGSPEADKLFIATEDGTAIVGSGTVWQLNRPTALKHGTITANTAGGDGFWNYEFVYSGDGTNYGFTGDATTSTGKIPDSTTANGAQFLLSVWDSVDTRTNVGGVNRSLEEYQLSAYHIIGMNVGNADQEVPRAEFYDFNPFTETGGMAAVLGGLNRPDDHPPVNLGTQQRSPANLNKGGLYNKGTAGIPVPSGHIEPRRIGGNDGGRHPLLNPDLSQGGAYYPAGQATFDKDVLSGAVIIRGRAYDNQRVAKLTLTIGANTIPLFATDPGTGRLVKQGSIDAGYQDFQDFRGHTVEWAYVWNTETMPAGQVLGDVTIQVQAEDRAGNVSTYTVQDGSHQYGYNQIGVELAPYTTELVRANAAYATKRSKQGWYSASRGETMYIQGYNFKAGTTRAVTLHTTTLTANAGPGTGIAVAIPSDSTGGRIKVKINSVDTVNERRTRLNPWNREEAAGIPGSELWDDIRNIHVWAINNNDSNSADNGRFKGSTGASNPAMSIDPSDGTLYASWIRAADQTVYFGSNNGENAHQILNSSDPQFNTDIHFNIASNSDNTTTTTPSGNNIGKYGNRAGPTVAYEMPLTLLGRTTGTDVGGINVWDRRAPGWTSSSGSNNAAGDGNALNDPRQLYRLGYTYNQGGYVDRFRFPRVVTYGSNIYTSYYDQYRYGLWFSKTTVGTANKNASHNTANNQSYGRRLIDSTSGAYPSGTDSNQNARWGGENNKTSDVAIGATKTVDAGAYSAIDVDNRGRPVIAYYEAVKGTVKVALAKDAAADNWTLGEALSSSDPYYSGSGAYISMRVDSDNYIHLAFYNNIYNSVIYAKGRISGDTVNFGNFESAMVDGSIRVGSWTDISLDAKKRPWIVYQDKGRYDDTDGMKVAYLDPDRFTKAAADQNGRNVGGWEALSAASVYQVKDERLSIEAKTSGFTGKFWDAAVGYLSDDGIRAAFYIKPPLP